MKKKKQEKDVKKLAYPLQVRTESGDDGYGGSVVITQSFNEADGEVVYIALDQIGLLIEWLVEARDELRSSEQ